jgi:hypothetical protein
MGDNMCDCKDDVPKGCKPFDLAKALAGEEVVTRDGVEAILAIYPLNFNLNNSYSGHSYNLQGQFYSNGDISDKDLFMKAKTKIIYVNIYWDWTKNITTGGKYNTEEEAKKNITYPAHYIKTIEIEVDDNDIQ